MQLSLIEASVCTPCGIALPSLRKAVTKTTYRIFATELAGLRSTGFRYSASECGSRQAGLGFSSLIETTRIESSSTKQLGRDRRVSGLADSKLGVHRETRRSGSIGKSRGDQAVIPPESTIAIVSVPASVANLGVGFDVHSMALQLPRIEVRLAGALRNVRKIQLEGPYAKDTTDDPDLNASGRALDAVYKQFGKPDGYILTIQVNMPPRAGLGLSGAEAVGAVLCAAVSLDLNLGREDIARIAARAEPMHHMDNVAACAFGGFNIIARHPMYESPRVTTITPPTDLGVAVVVPDVVKESTAATRELLPQTVSREQYVESMSYASRLTAALAKGDLNTLIETIPWDPVVEPARAAAGAYGSGVDAEFLQWEKRELLDKFHVAETISGAGPSHALWYCISEDQDRRKNDGVGLIKPAIELVSDRLRALGHNVKEVFITKPSSKGATILYSARSPRDRSQ
jgi:homoserine kinase